MTVSKINRVGDIRHAGFLDCIQNPRPVPRAQTWCAVCRLEGLQSQKAVKLQHLVCIILSHFSAHKGCPQRSPAARPCAAGGDGRMAKSKPPPATPLYCLSLHTASVQHSTYTLHTCQTATATACTEPFVFCACREGQQPAAARRLGQHRRRHAQQRERVHSRQPAGRLRRRGPRG